MTNTQLQLLQHCCSIGTMAIREGGWDTIIHHILVGVFTCVCMYHLQLNCILLPLNPCQSSIVFCVTMFPGQGFPDHVPKPGFPCTCKYSISYAWLGGNCRQTFLEQKVSYISMVEMTFGTVKCVLFIIVPSYGASWPVACWGCPIFGQMKCD